MVSICKFYFLEKYFTMLNYFISPLFKLYFFRIEMEELDTMCTFSKSAHTFRASNSLQMYINDVSGAQPCVELYTKSHTIF